MYRDSVTLPSVALHQPLSVVISSCYQPLTISLHPHTPPPPPPSVSVSVFQCSIVITRNVMDHTKHFQKHFRSTLELSKPWYLLLQASTLEPFIISFDSWEATREMQMRVCCDDVCPLTTYSGSLKGERSWRRLALQCPKTTRTVGVCPTLAHKFFLLSMATKKEGVF
ncbi:unnamed protein product [Haemonchus placei]|uniref:Uncharacterized protein n=1 Tax=Haemonchus placei TaxID=6290 RepID=A0A3P7VA64_HAEPC|nr:unnamed protein product [Haemonchus placei]